MRPPGNAPSVPPRAKKSQPCIEPTLNSSAAWNVQEGGVFRNASASLGTSTELLTKTTFQVTNGSMDAIMDGIGGGGGGRVPPPKTTKKLDPNLKGKKCQTLARNF